MDNGCLVSVDALRLCAMTISARGRQGRIPEPDQYVDANGEELHPHWVPRFAPARSLVDNVFSLARPLWGRARAEWTMWLAEDLVADLPDADGVDRRQWAAAILWAAALDAGMVAMSGCGRISSMTLRSRRMSPRSTHGNA